MLVGGWGDFRRWRRCCEAGVKGHRNGVLSLALCSPQGQEVEAPEEDHNFLRGKWGLRGPRRRRLGMALITATPPRLRPLPPTPPDTHAAINHCAALLSNAAHNSCGAFVILSPRLCARVPVRAARPPACPPARRPPACSLIKVLRMNMYQSGL